MLARHVAAWLLPLSLLLNPLGHAEDAKPAAESAATTGTATAPRVVYGTDDRLDVYQVTDATRLAQAAATCGLIDVSDLTDNGNGTYTIKNYAYTQSGLPPCASEPFRTQRVSAYCTGFLVAPDVIATAGHCVDDSNVTDMRVVFGWKMVNGSTIETVVNSNRVYRGTQLLGHALSGSTDYSVVKLDRAVTAPGAVPLEIRRTGKIGDTQAVGVIGHPAGLPMKIAFGSTTRVRDNSPSVYFAANLDTYGGNSGSPVFNATTNVVEGILVRGQQDFDLGGSCFSSNELPDNTTDAEDVTRSTVWQEYVPVVSSTIALNATTYGNGATVTVTVTDTTPANPMGATLTTTLGDNEFVSLGSIGNNQYRGTIVVNNAALVAGNGTLQGNASDTLTASYESTTAQASLDLAAPAISNVVVYDVSYKGFVVAYRTSEQANTQAIIGTDCAVAQVTQLSGPGTQHFALFETLSPCTLYQLRLNATDLAGNAATYNGGACVPVTTTNASVLLLERFTQLALPAGWSSQTLAGTNNWGVRAASNARSTPNAAGYEPGSANTSDAVLISPSVTNPTSLTFWHAYDFEDGSSTWYDGGVLEYNVNGGAWTDIGARITEGGYNAVVTGSNAMGSRSAWSGPSGQYPVMSRVRVNLAGLTGQVQLRWRFGSDSSVASAAWRIDDVEIIAEKPCGAQNEAQGWVHYQ